MGGIVGALVGDVVGAVTGGGSSSSSSALLNQEEAQFQENFALQTTQAMYDNQNATNTAIANSHAQTWASATAGEREAAQANAHIDA